MTNPFLLLLIPLMGGWSHAQTEMVVIDSSQKSRTWPSVRARLFATDTKTRVEVRGQGVKQDMIYHGRPQQVLWMIDQSRKTIIKVTETDLKSLESSAKFLKNYTDRYLNTLSEDQKKRVRTALRALDRMKSQGIQYRKTQTGVTVGRFQCDRYAGSVTGFFTLKLQHCTVPWQQLSIKRQQFRAMQSMYAFLTRAESATGVSSGSGSLSQGNFPGFPVETLSTVNGKGDYRVQINKIQRARFQPGLFVPPQSGYQKIQLPSFPPPEGS